MRDPNQIVCAMCGEPFSVQYVQGEMEDENAEEFLHGHGCPSCDWGEAENATGEYEEEHMEQLVHGNYDGDATEYLL